MSIVIKNLVKEFKKPIRGDGIKDAFKTLFSRKYEVTTAVNNINLEINDGEIVGYIGANGAGKSTTIKMMCGILTPTSGEVLINGIDPFKKRRQVAEQIGVVFGQKTQLWWDIPLIETFKVLKDVYQISDEDYKERMKLLSDLLGLDEFLHQPVRTLSLGQRMRGDLAAAWLHNPRILFLDEPTIGLDVLVKQKIRDAIKLMNQRFKTTIILTTHDMQDIEDLCSRIVMIEKGQIIYDGSIANIKHKFGDLRTLTVPLNDSIVLEKLNTFNGKVKYSINKDESTLVIKFNADDVSLEEVSEYVFHDLHSKDMKVSELNIEDVVKTLFEENEKAKSKQA